ncbi:putative cytochrome P450 [Talaromyces proteolyticus]|uniref:Cytochrome P450 n=1 Tax=Talaromyces proteolyticus TaxID=1131652 RepID=A0AAD4KK89_9EURO|nr:putative cytochrome P450 [Talaromyces proteolyticus]KAH8693657.1 putative cytochrome P450 [Talaromyces proteolyticus]
MAVLTTLTILSLVAGFVYALLTVGHRDPRYPPGPPTLPFIGNLHQLPTKHIYLKLTEFAKIYGGLYTLKFGTGTVAVITDRRIVRELLDRKSSTSSARPASYITQKIISDGDHLLTVPYGQYWRTARRTIHQHFMESMCEHHDRIQHAEAVQMLRDFVFEPEKYMLHPKRFSNSTITSILYGVRSPSYESTQLKLLYEIMDHFTTVMEPGAMPPVDIYPWLKYIPERFLRNWVSRATQVKHEMHFLYESFLQHIIRRREEQGSKDSFLDKILDNNGKPNFTHNQMRFVGGNIMEAGSDTTANVLTAFIQAVTKWPRVQRKAQEEIDAKIGEDRTPNWADYSSLPYVAAIVKETMRWRPVTPLGIPHALDEDEWVDGKLLPKGTTLIMNTWGLHHDEKQFANPDVFNPDRYAGKTLSAAEYAISPDYENRDHYGYGAGRRLCVGIHLAERNLFLAMSMLLWAFNFEKEIDLVTKKPLEPDISPLTGYHEGIVTSAKPFPCKVTLRSEARRETILREFEDVEVEILSKYETSIHLGK